MRHVIQAASLDHLDDLDTLDHLWCMERLGIVGLGAIGGSLALGSGKVRPAATGDYQPWTPD